MNPTAYHLDNGARIVSEGSWWYLMDSRGFKVAESECEEEVWHVAIRLGWVEEYGAREAAQGQGRMESMSEPQNSASPDYTGAKVLTQERLVDCNRNIIPSGTVCTVKGAEQGIDGTWVLAPERGSLSRDIRYVRPCQFEVLNP